MWGFSVFLIVAIHLRPIHQSSVDIQHVLREEAVSRLNQLGEISDAPNFLQRTFLSPAAIQASRLIEEWMQDAGLQTWIDDIGNVHGRFNGFDSSAPALLLGSHLDTVIDAGKYDGALGIIAAIAAIKALDRTGDLWRFPRPIEVIAFSDEEGVRFQSTFLGSAAIAGVLPPQVRAIQDKSGLSLEEVLKTWPKEGKKSIYQLKYDPSSIWGYVEVHIEQGPVLEATEIPLGVVEVIAGQSRFRVSIQGSQGHAGTVPMAMRKDPMPAAAQAIFGIEELCKSVNPEIGLVCTVGEISMWPGASNVIPGEVVFSLDVRAKDDQIREQMVSGIEVMIHKICSFRGLSYNFRNMHEAKAVRCDKDLTEELKRASEAATVTNRNKDIPSLMSGAGHDALALSHLTKVGMVFVRCSGGISHSPLEKVSPEDVEASSRVLFHFLKNHINLHHLGI